MWGIWNFPIFLLRIINPDVHGHPDGPGHVVHLPTVFGGIVCIDVMVKDVTMVVDGRWGPKMFLEPFPTSPSQFTNILLLAIHLVTLETRLPHSSE